MVTTRIRKPRTEREYEEIIDELITQGYKIESRGDRTTQLMHAKYGGIVSHILIFILFGWWTFFIANIIWLAYNYYSHSDRVLVKLITKESTCPKCQAKNPSEAKYCEECGTSLK